MTAIAQIKYEQNQYAEALKQIKEAEKLCYDKKIFDLLPDVFYNYYKAYKLMGNLPDALKYYEKYTFIKDSLSGVELNEKISALEIKYETEKKQQEIELLNIENETKKQKLNARNLLIFSLVLLVILIIVTAYYFRQRGMQQLNQMESELQKYLLKMKGLENVKADNEGISEDLISKNGLTEREKEVLHLMREGLSNTDIAEKIFVSPNTIKYHIKNIYIKLDVKNRVEAINKLKV